MAANLNKLNVNNKLPKSNLGKDILYICPNCRKEEKQFALPSRLVTVCQACGDMAIQSHLMDTYHWVK